MSEIREFDCRPNDQTGAESPLAWSLQRGPAPAADAQARTRFSSTDPPPLLTSIRTSPARGMLGTRPCSLTHLPNPRACMQARLFPAISFPGYHPFPRSGA